jgi:Glycosyl transferase family 21
LEARGEWLLFVDADVVLARECVTAALAAAHEQSADLLTLMPRLEAAGVGEALLLATMPLTFAGFLPQVLVMGRRWPLVAGALGKFLLFRRETYLRIGGHEAVRTDIVEDMQLSRLVKRHGGRLFWCGGTALARATAYLEESVARLRAVGQESMAASFLTLVGLIALDRGDLERARVCCAESLAFARRTGADHPQGFALACLAHVARRRDDLVAAAVLGREELLVWRRLGSPAHIAGGLEGLAQTAAAAGERAQAERAARLLGAAAALRERVGVSPGERGRVHMERATAEARLILGETGWAEAFAAGRALVVQEAITEALGEVAEALCVRDDA